MTTQLDNYRGFGTLVREAALVEDAVMIELGDKVAIIATDLDGINVVGFTCRIYAEGGADEIGSGSSLIREEAFRLAWDDYLDSMISPKITDEMLYAALEA
jgi:hypothetical protein